MNEEIVVKFGGDLTPLGQSLRSMNAAVKQAGQETKNVLKESFGSIGSIISGGAILAGLKGLLDHFEELNDRAQNLSISTDFLQGMQHIASKDAVGGVETFNKAITELSTKLGDAKSGGEEAIKKFSKWGITLKDIADLDTEGMFYKIADRIKSIPDPSERSAAAFELLGKAGKNLVGVMQDGSAAVKGMVDQVDKLDAEKIKMLAEAKGTISDVSNTATIAAGKSIGAIGKASQFVGGVMGGEGDSRWTKMQARWNAEDYARAHPDAGPDKSILAAQAEKLLAASTKYLDSVAREQGGQTMLNSLVRTRHDLQAKINAMQGDSVEKYALMTEFAKNEKDIREQQAKMDKESFDKRKAADDKKAERLKEEKELTKDIQHTRNEIAKIGRERAASQRADYMPSLEEVANSGYQVFRHNQNEWQEGPFAGMARQLLNLQGDAKQSLIWGNQDRFKNDVSRIDELKKSLAAAGVMSPDDRMKSLDESMGEAKDHLKELVSKATTDGIKVIGPED